MSKNEARAREALKALTLEEKLELVQDLWDEIAESPESIELTPEQREEAERRLSEHERNPGRYPTWEEVRRELEGPQ
jgi:putative addiction module component (TIGR02574 family)